MVKVVVLYIKYGVSCIIRRRSFVMYFNKVIYHVF